MTTTLVKTMTARDTQLANEYTYSKKHIDSYIRSELEACEPVMEQVVNGSKLLSEWMDPVHEYYPSKRARLDQLLELDIPKLVLEVFIGIAYCQTEVLFTSVSAQLASRLNFNDKSDSILTVAEIIAVLSNTQVFGLYKENKYASIKVKSNVTLSTRLTNYIANAEYLPPMLCEPEPVTTNSQSGYLTYDESVILRAGNHHNDNISLDVINKQNHTALSLDMDFLKSVEEEPTFELDTTEKVKAWNTFKKKSMDFYALMHVQATDNKVYLTNKYDKRGRLYSQGYYINTQGTAYKKAMLNFAKEETIEVPEEFKL